MLYRQIKRIISHDPLLEIERALTQIFCLYIKHSLLCSTTVQHLKSEPIYLVIKMEVPVTCSC